MEPTKAISTTEFIESAFESTTEKKALKDHLDQRLLISQLAALRASKDITQAQLAAAMKCGQSRVSKLEAGIDAELTMADLEAYAKATESDVAIILSKRGSNIAEQIKWHAVSIRRLFLRLVKLAHKDDLIAKGVAKLHLEAFQNLNAFLAETANQLPVTEDGSPYIRIEKLSDKDEPTSVSKSPKKKRKPKRTNLPTKNPKKLSPAVE